ncbi:hypothetical protein NN561_013908 [Cricetulus griseus]
MLLREYSVCSTKRPCAPHVPLSSVRRRTGQPVPHHPCPLPAEVSALCFRVPSPTPSARGTSQPGLFLPAKLSGIPRDFALQLVGVIRTPLPRKALDAPPRQGAICVPTANAPPQLMWFPPAPQL